MWQIVKIASFISMALWIAACGKNNNAEKSHDPENTEVSVIKVKSQVLDIQVELPGRSKAFLEAEVKPQASGIIIQRSFIEGSNVKKGQSLYQIDSATYKARLLSVEAELASAKANLILAKATVTRYKVLIKTNVESLEKLDEKIAAYKVALAKVVVAKAAVNTAKINLVYSEVKAPISGRIGKSNVTVGALVSADNPKNLARIQQLDPINVDIAQSSAQLLRLKAKLKQGQLQATNNANVQLILEDGTAYGYSGVLQFSEVSVDENTGSVTLRAKFPNPNGLLLPGMYVRAVLNAGTDLQAILIPQEALTRNTKGQAVVMLVDSESRVESRVVTTAEVIDHQWRITHGLNVGDTLIVEGLQMIHPGDPVKPIAASSDQSANILASQSANQ
ncbi:RND family efflux transporter, MFP subunit [Shewanella psychrophila]|uniref:RND family efflux transporter, MFP subunit n=1 Tax=Shewanella psychrophila TaxID=225848 RepID=A0A1S6HUM9_9GAMM|nr:efflux RND transporter periplasmic adaptor subunit [Shewanella psychrophila]AQS39255.1 RND family efflux transporter, MFP subunit [Shewanella psychrophila]